MRREENMKVAAIQLNSTSDKKRNVERALFLSREAIKANANLVCFPEVFNYRGDLSDATLRNSIAEYIPGFSTYPFMEQARQHKIWILLGSLPERKTGNKKVFNTSILIGPGGKVVAKYRKIHLFNARVGNKKIQESRYFLEGEKPVLTKILGLNLGMSICFDVRFPDMFQSYAQGGCHMISVPSNFTKKTGQAHWEVLLRARAIENHCYIIAPNQCGRDSCGVEAFGHSMIVNPWGDVLAKASLKQEEIIFGEVERGLPEKTRKIFFNRTRKRDV